MKNRRSQPGFTLIELMIATVVFSLVMLVLLASFLQIGRIFYKGISYASTQESGRAISESISDDVRFAKRVTMSPTGPYRLGSSDTYWFCIGKYRYTYTLYEQLSVADLNNPLKGVQRTVNESCAEPNSTQPGLSRQQMLGPEMQINKFIFNCTNGRCIINIRLVFFGAQNDVFASDSNPGNPLRSNDLYCTGPLLSSQFCGTFEVNTLVSMRE